MQFAAASGNLPLTLVIDYQSISELELIYNTRKAWSFVPLIIVIAVKSLSFATICGPITKRQGKLTKYGCIFGTYDWYSTINQKFNTYYQQSKV